VQPKNIQIPLDLNEISVPYLNEDGSVSSMPYAASGGIPIGGGANLTPQVESVVVSANAWSDDQKRFYDRWDLEPDGSRWFAPQNLRPDEYQRVATDPILHGGGTIGQRAAQIQAQTDILRAGLWPVDVGMSVYNIGAGKGGLRDYLAVGGAVAGPILGKAAGVAAPVLSRFGRLGGIAAKGGSVTFEGTLYRAVPEGGNPLDISYSIVENGRYTAPGQGGLYFASNARAVEAEFVNNGSSLTGRTVHSFPDTSVDNLLDLTNSATRADLGVSLSDLTRTGGTSAWRYEITQPLGAYAQRNGYAGIIAPSAQADGGVNLILFGSKGVR
jgi:RES domain-containing protein